MSNQQGEETPVLDYRPPSAEPAREWVKPYDLWGIAVVVMCMATATFLALPNREGGARWFVVMLPVTLYLRRWVRRLAGAPADDQEEPSERIFRRVVWAITSILLLMTSTYAGCRIHGWSFGMFGVGINHSTGGGPCNLPYGEVNYWYVTSEWCVWSTW